MAKAIAAMVCFLASREFAKWQQQQVNLLFFTDN